MTRRAKEPTKVTVSLPGFAMGTEWFLKLDQPATIVRYEGNIAVIAVEMKLPITALHFVEGKGK